jgi:hypothetical protein
MEFTYCKYLDWICDLLWRLFVQFPYAAIGAAVDNQTIQHFVANHYAVNVECLCWVFGYQ